MRGYMECCSRKCSSNLLAADPERNAHKVAAMESTTMERYGVRSVTMLESNKEQRKKTMMERYGVEYYSQHPDFINKYHDGNMKHFGVKSYAETQEFKDKIIASNMKRYGVPFFFCLKTEQGKTLYESILAKYDCHIVDYTNRYKFTYRCDKCGNVMDDAWIFINSRDANDVTPCWHCVPKRPFRSFDEMAMDDYVKSLGMETEHHERNFLGEYGADIVVKSKKVAIEYDGIFWHSDEYRPADYHIMKTRLAEEMGYALIHVFSDEWDTRKGIVKDNIRRILGVKSVRTVMASDCRLGTVNENVCNKFIDDNSLFRSKDSNVRYALHNGNEIVAVMTFNLNGTGNATMTDFVLKNGVDVPGAARTLFYAVLVQHREIMAVTATDDRRWNLKKPVLESLGFSRISEMPSEYKYVHANVRYSIQEAMERNNISGSLSDEEVRIQLASNGYARIYDCGNWKYEWKRP